MPRPLLPLILSIALSPVLAQPATIDVSNRLVPGVDSVAEMTTDSQQTISVTNDRGIVAKLSENGVRLPLHLNMVQRRRIRTTTSPAKADGGFSVTIAVLDSSTAIRLPSGEERDMPQKVSLAGNEVTAQVSPAGEVLPESLQLQGPEAANKKAILPVMASVLAQASAMPALAVSLGQSASQTQTMKIPVASLASIDLTITTTYRLIETIGDVAVLDMTYTMSFGAPAQPMKMVAHGSGSGSMRYDTRLRRAVEQRDYAAMEFELELPDGTLKVIAITRTNVAVRDASAATATATTN